MHYTNKNINEIWGEKNKLKLCEFGTPNVRKTTD